MRRPCVAGAVVIRLTPCFTKLVTDFAGGSGARCDMTLAESSEVGGLALRTLSQLSNQVNNNNGWMRQECARFGRLKSASGSAFF